MEKRKFKIHLNIGTVIFGAIFIYLCITMVLYLSHKHVDTYQVISGPLIGNETTTALILRDEDVVLSTASGYVNHFLADGSKVGKSQLVCAVTTGQIPLESKELTDDDYNDLLRITSSSSKSYDGDHFDRLYSLKYNIQSMLWNTNSVSSSAGSFFNAANDGVVSYSSDGLEYYTEQDITSDVFRTSAQLVTKLPNQSYVNINDPLFRIIKSEQWSVYFPVTDKQTVRLAPQGTIKVKFLKDDNYETGTLSFFESGEERFAKITFSSGMVRYAEDRYADIEIITNTESGLKIPLSSIVKKEFYLIPEDFLTYDTENNNGVTKEVFLEDGSKTTQFTEVTIYAGKETDDGSGKVYYVDKSLFNEGDILISKEGTLKYSIGPVGTLEGVYCVNKGYAVFRRIVITDQNDEYCIVESGTSYGLSLYDYIVRDGSTVSESDVVVLR